MNKPSQGEQAAYKTIVTQVIDFLSRPNVAAEIEKMAQQMGPEQALAAVIVQGLQMVGQAAKGAGADVPMHTGQAAIKEIVLLMVSAMSMSGMVKDPQASAQQVMQLIQQAMRGGRQQQPQQSQQPQPQLQQGLLNQGI